MKKIYLFALVSTLSLASKAQSNSLLKHIDSARRFLATTDLVYPYIDTPPGYPGGDEKWSSYVTNSSIMKEAIDKARAQKIPSGKYTVHIKFAVNTDGTVGDARTTSKPVGYGLDEAAVKLVRGSGKWIPANIEGENKKAYLQLPVNFTIVEKVNE